MVFKGDRYDRAQIYPRWFRNEWRTTLTFRVIPRTVYGDEEQLVIKETDRIDNLAAQFYGDPRLWHIIADANPQVDHMDIGAEVGKVLLIPPASRVLR